MLSDALWAGGGGNAVSTIATSLSPSASTCPGEAGAATGGDKTVVAVELAHDPHDEGDRLRFSGDIAP